MILKTKFHGDVGYKKEDVLTFTKGILGFEEIKEYILFPLQNNDAFKVLHSITDEDIGFVVMSPFDICKNYEFELNKSQELELQVKTPKDVIVYSIVTVSSKVTDITVNLRAPIVINLNGKLGKQIVLNDEKYKVKTPIIEEKN